jgi:hypothetical protein
MTILCVRRPLPFGAWMGVTSTSAAGTAATEAAEPLHFDGWLELLRVLSELVAAAPSSGADPGAVPRPSAGR